MHTHYVSAHAPVDGAGHRLAACCTVVSALDVAPLGTPPTCWGCAMWLTNLDVIEPAAVPEEAVTA